MSAQGSRGAGLQRRHSYASSSPWDTSSNDQHPLGPPLQQKMQAQQQREADAARSERRRTEVYSSPAPPSYASPATPSYASPAPPGYPKPVWHSYDNADGRRPGSSQKLPAMEDMVMRSAFGQPPPEMYRHSASGGNTPHVLAPMNDQLHAYSRQAVGLDDRLCMLESKMMAAERMAQEATIAYEVQAQRFAGMSGEVQRSQQDLHAVRTRYESQVAANGQLTQELAKLASEVRNQDARVAQLSAQLDMSMRSVAEMRGMHGERSGDERLQAQASSGQVQQQLATLSGELRRSDARVEALSAQVQEGAHANGDLRAQLSVMAEELRRSAMDGSSVAMQQVMAMQREMRQQESRMEQLGAQLHSAHAANEALRGQVATLNEETVRAAADRQASAAAMERLARQFHDGASMLAEENRRVSEENAAAFREDSRKRQQAFLGELGALNREVESYREEAASAGAQLHAGIERMAMRMAAEEAALMQLRQTNAVSAEQEATQLSALHQQHAELQQAMAGMMRQLAGEQAMRQAEMQGMNVNMHVVQQQLQVAQDQAVQRTVMMIEQKAASMMRAVMDVDEAAGARADGARDEGEQQVALVARAAAHKERTALERMLMLEGAMRGVAQDAGQQIADLTARVNRGIQELAAVAAASKADQETREAELRVQVNSALQKVRMYAQEMEQAQDQERSQLEEVVKTEIKSRIAGQDQLRLEMADLVAGMQDGRSKQAGDWNQNLKLLRGNLDSTRDAISAEVMKELHKQLARLDEVLAAETAAREQAITALTAEFINTLEGTSLAEEGMRGEIAGILDAISEGRNATSEEISATIGVIRAEAAEAIKEARESRKERAELSEMVATHSDLFVEVHCNLESATTRITGMEGQIVEMGEQTAERFEAVDAVLHQARDETRAELDATKAEIEDKLADTLVSVDDKVAANAAEQDAARKASTDALETVITELQVELEERVGKLETVVDENQVLVDEEIVALQDEVDIKIGELGAALEKGVDVVMSAQREQEERIASTMAAVMDQGAAELAAAKEATAQALEALEADSHAKIQEVTAMVQALETEVAGQLQALEAEAAEKLAALKGESDEALAAVQEAMSGRINETEAATAEAFAQASQETDAAIAAALDVLATQQASTDAAFAEVKHAAETDRASVRAELDAARSAVATAIEVAAAKAAADAVKMSADLEQSRSTLTASMEQTWSTMASDSHQTFTALSEAMAESAADQDAKIEDARTDASAAIEAAVDAVEKRLHDHADRLNQVDAAVAETHGSVTGALEKRIAGFEGALDKAVTSMAAANSAFRDEVNEELEGQRDFFDQKMEAVRRDAELSAERGAEEAHAAIANERANREAEVRAVRAGAEEQRETVSRALPQIYEAKANASAAHAAAMRAIQAQQEMATQEREEHTARINAAESRLTGLEDSVNDVALRLDAARAEVQADQTTLAENTEDAITAAAAAAEARLDALQAQIDDIASGAKGVGVPADVHAHMESVAREVGALARSLDEDKERLEGVIVGVSAKIDTLQLKVDNTSAGGVARAAELEAALHSALDEGLETMRGEVRDVVREEIAATAEGR